MLNISQSEIQQFNSEQIAGMILTLLRDKTIPQSYQEGALGDILYFVLSPIWLGKNIKNGMEILSGIVRTYGGDEPPEKLRSLYEEGVHLLWKEDLIKQDHTQTSNNFVLVTDKGKKMRISDTFHLRIFIDRTKIIEQYSPSILLMETESGNDTSCGTCFYIGNGTFITCRHNIEGRTFSLHFDKEGTSLPQNHFEILPHHQRDVAILKIAKGFRPLTNPLTPLRFGNSTQLKMGDNLITIGYPLVPQRLPEQLSSSGIFSNFTKDYTGTEKYLTFTNKIEGGYSGGPVINEYGEVVGIITESTERSGGTDGSQPSAVFYHGTPIEEAIEMLKSK